MKDTKVIRVVSVHSGDHEDLHKDVLESVLVDAEGFPDDRHRGFTRVAWQGEKDAEGTVRRKERQCEGIPEFSQLPRGTRTSTGEPAVGKMFGKHSYGLRGVVGVVDIPGEIRTGDRVKLEVPR